MNCNTTHYRANSSSVPGDPTVELPDTPQALLRVCTALLQGEVNIIQAYPLLIRPHGRPVVALMVDNIEMGMEILSKNGFEMISEADLHDEE